MYSYTTTAYSSGFFSALTSENAVKAKFVRNVYYDVGLIRASRKAEADF
jgi:hypothetical protein